LKSSNENPKTRLYPFLLAIQIADLAVKANDPRLSGQPHDSLA